jgi:hypothetical protein
MAWALPDAEGLTEPEGCVVAFNARTGENQNMVCYDSKSSMFYYKDNKKNVYMGAGECGTSPPGVWHHIAFTIDASNNGVLYIDAEPKVCFAFALPCLALLFDTTAFLGDVLYVVDASYANSCTYVGDLQVVNSAVDDIAVQHGPGVGWKHLRELAVR